jgi:hypothetical protein
MKKLIFIAVASFFLVQASNAQLFNYGIKGGIGFSSLSINDLTGISDGTDVYDLVTGDGVMGYHLGVQTRIKIAMIYVQPELYWNAGGGTLEQVIDGGATEILEVKFNRIDMPLLVGVKLGPVRLNIGPVGSYVISETNDGSTADFDYELYLDAMNWGWQGGIGVDLLKLSLDVRYEGSLSDLSDSVPEALQDYNMDPRPSQWIITLGYWFK